MKKVIVIGAGAVGCAIARELSKFNNFDVTVLEKESDVAGGTSGRNSAVVHAGFNNKPGTLMAKFCVEGNEGFSELCEKLDVPYIRTGKLLIAFNEDDVETLKKMKLQGEKNGCSGIRLLNREELDEMFPKAGGISAMYSPKTAIFNPFKYTVALAENANDNGVKFIFNANVDKIAKQSDGTFRVACGETEYGSDFVVNCAGLYADVISEIAGIGGYKIYPCRGEYLILDKPKKEDDELTIPIYPAPRKGIGGLGVHLTPTTDGNVIIGPSNEYIDENDDYSSTKAVMDKLLREAKELMPSIDAKNVIGAYSGIRPKLTDPEHGGYNDFIIKEEESLPGFINLIGIESPGMTASVPIARYVRGIIESSCGEKLSEKANFREERRGIVKFADKSPEEQAALIKENPEYGDIVCRCQHVTRAEIRQAIENPLGVKTVSAVKYRAWATTGRCSGGYCMPKIAEMLVREYGTTPENVTYRSPGSEMFTGFCKEEK